MHSGKRTILSIFVIILLSAICIQARNLNLRFDKIGINQGLSHSTVTAIHLDSQGYLWFGTQDGLNRYDGYSFTIFRHTNTDSTSLSSNWITSIDEDIEGNLWIGTSGGGVNCFDPHHENFVNYAKYTEESESHSDNFIVQVKVDSSNTLWIITAAGELRKYNQNEDTFEPVKIAPKLKDISLSVVAEGINGKLWFGTKGSGLICFDKNKQSSEIFDENARNGICDNYITDLDVDMENNLWIATQDGICMLNQADNSIVQYRKGKYNSRGLLDNHIKKIFMDSQHTLWISTELGLNIKSPDEKHFNYHRHQQGNQQSIGTHVINTIVEDNSGIIWIGTYLDGINKFDRSKNLFTHLSYEPDNSNSLSDNNIWGLYEADNGDIWIGTNKGLNQYSPKNSSFTHYLSKRGKGNLNNNVVRSVTQGPGGDIWCGTDGGGVNRLNLRSGKFSYYQYNPKNPNSLINDNVKQIYKDRDQNIWIATWNGLDRYDWDNNTFIHYQNNPDKLTSLCDNRVQCILEDKQGQIWIGTYDGLNVMDKSSGQCTWYKNDPQKPSSISDNRILSIYEDHQGGIWIGTYHGLNKLNSDKVSFTRYTVSDGLINDVIHGIVEDDSNTLWMSTNKGLIRYNPLAPEIRKYKNYDIYDGLSGNEFNTGSYLKSKDGYFYFGCVNGLNKFIPSRVELNKHVPPVVITSFKKFDRDVTLAQAIHLTKKINLSYKDNFFAFEFAALDFVNPHKNQYAYKLDGFDEEWIQCGTRNYASYTNLDGGKYTFNVRGTNNDAIWNNRSTSVEINITPPIWKNWWFIYISIFLVGTVTSLLIWNWQRQERVKREMLKLQVDDRTEDVRASLKKLRKTQQEAKNLAAKTRLLYDIGQRISNQLDLDTLLNNIVINARDTFDYYNVMLLFKDDERNGLVIKSIAGGYKDIYAKELIIKMGQGITGKAAQKRSPELSNNVSENVNYFNFESDVTKSELAIPIINQSELIGVLDIQSDKLNEFTESDVEVFETFCSQVASAINNANLFEQVQNELKERKKAEKKLLESRDLLITAKNETDNIFQNIEEGLFQINSNGEIGGQYSKSLEMILGEAKLAGKVLTDLLKDKIPEKVYKSTTEYVELMFDEKIDEETLVELNPLQDIELNIKDSKDNWVDSEFLMFKFKRSYDINGKISALIVSVNDVSQQKKLALQLEKTEAEQKNQVEWMFSILHVEPALLREFMEISKRELNDVAQLLKSTKNPEDYHDVINKILRVMINLKDSASLLDIKLFERKAQKFEDSVQRLLKLKKIQGSDFISLVIQLEDMRSIIHEIETLIERLASIHSIFKSSKKSVNKGSRIKVT
ncbi:MAG: two-component regulator propeller domain-containing protein [Calditrichaceae bacterium]